MGKAYCLLPAACYTAEEHRMILILTRFEADPTVERLSRVLRAAGDEPVIVAPTTLEGPAAFFIANDPAGGGRSWLRLADREIDLRAVRAAWLWRSWRPEPLEPRYGDLAQQRYEWRFFESEWASFHKGFALTLAHHGIFCVNPPPANAAFEEKCCQLWLAAEVGLAIPPTLYTTSLPIVRDFYNAHGESIIYKPFHAHFHLTEAQGDQPRRVARLLTNRVRADDLIEPPDFRPTPGVFQPYVEKHFELRVVVVGRRLFACAIHSQRSEISREDWRRYDFDHTPYEPYDLPVDVADKLLALMDRLGLVFGSIDMIVTPAGEHVFLEINPNGQFDFVAQLAGLPIYEHLAAMLLAGRVDYAVEATREVAHVG
jgi:glutathione synthase/RimK-type ligase-like ATP-grasp enzyme